MSKKELTRKEKYQDFRDEITGISDEEKKERKIESIKKKSNLHPIVNELNEKRVRKIAIYYGILSIVTIIVIFLFVYYGVNYL